LYEFIIGLITQKAYDFDHMDLYIPTPLRELLPAPLLKQCVAYAFSKGDYLFHLGKVPEYMFYIVSGEAVLSRTSSQGEITTLQRCKGGFVSEASLLTDVYHCDAIATHAGTAITLPIKAFRDSLKKEDFSLKWVKLLSREIMRLRTQSERLGLKDIKSKLIHLIETEGKNGILTLQSDYKSLASELGITHEALYRAISKMELAGLIYKTTDSLKLINKVATP
jgi:CRP-like cAMP-binding protein